MTELTTTQGNALALASDQDFWNEKQIAALKQLGVEKATNGDLAVFHHVCQRTGLDPFARQIYMIERQGKQTIQTGIDGLRLVARRAVDRTGESLSIDLTEWADAEGTWTDVWLSDKPPAAARVTVLRNGERFPGIALWREYAQTKRDGDLTAMWRDRPAGQLAKCAEALALRKAFPQDLSGIYTDDEIGTQDRRGPRPRQSSGLASALGRTQESPLLDPGSDLAKRMFATFNELGITDRDNRLLYVSDVVGRPIASSSEMTDADAAAVIDALQADLEDPFPAKDADVADAELVEDPS